jgi:hypothetical protein
MAATPTLRDKRIAVGLLLALLLIFYVASIATEYVQGANHGYGTGFSNQAHVPPQVVQQVAIQDHKSIPTNISAAALSNLTLGNHGHGLWHDTWRWALTIVALGVLLVFWYAVISRIGAI